MGRPKIPNAKSYNPIYNSFRAMHDRCLNKKHKSYDKYGGRGIKVCDRWLYNFDNFLADMGNRPTSMHSLDRINNDGNYEPSNCRWATKQQQVINRGMLSNNKSGYRGVNWDKKLCRWRSVIQVNRKKILIGFYEDILEADSAYRAAASKYFN